MGYEIFSGDSIIGKLARRKRLDASRRHFTELAKNLSVFELIPIGVGSTLGAGVYVLVGTVAREHSGPALTLCFLIAGFAAALSALCYAELASRCPSAGSAYHYAYLCVGEGVAWLIGWALILEYTVGGAAVARGTSPNVAVLIGGEDNLPVWLSRATIPGTEIVIDPCAAFIVLIATVLLCAGRDELFVNVYKEKYVFSGCIPSATVQSIITSANVLVLLFVIVAGSAIGFKTGWIGYRVGDGYLPFGINGMLGGAATVFFSYIGFDTVASTAEEVKNPRRDLPLGIGISLSICGCLYMLVSAVIVGIVPYDEMDSNTPISSAFSRYGVNWAMYIVSAGAVSALCSTLMGSLLPQPRILLAMARDGLLPRFFQNISQRTWVPINGMIVTGFAAMILSFFMDVDELSGMVSVGTLLAFAIVGISILILRYIPPDNAPLIPVDATPPSTIPTFTNLFPFDVTSQDVQQEKTIPLLDNPKEQLAKTSLDIGDSEGRSRWLVEMSILASVIGSVLIAVGACGELLPSWLRWVLGSVGACVFVSGSVVLGLLDQDKGRHTFGNSGGFICPFVPWLPLLSILINVYLLANLGLSTWLKVGIWLIVGVFIYLLYGMKHSMLSEDKREATPDENSILSATVA